jgi:protein CpxP
MKKYLLPLFAAFAFTVGTASAQTTPATTTTEANGMQGRGGYGGRMQGSPEEMAKRQTERMTQELGLSADQATKVQQIMVARGREMQAMRGQSGGDRDKMREQMQASRTKYDAQFKEVLTADQYTKYTTMQANRMNRGGGPGMDGPGVDKLKAKADGGDKVKMKDDKLKLKSAKSQDKDGKLKVKADQ